MTHKDKKYSFSDLAPNPETVTGYLGNIEFPADKQEILDKASDHSAPMSIMETLNALPEKSYSTVSEIMKELKTL